MESLADSSWGILYFHLQKKIGLFLCCVACEPKPVRITAKLFSWVWEHMIVCGGGSVYVREGRKMSAWVQQHECVGVWSHGQAVVCIAIRFITEVKSIYYMQSQLVTCQVER